MKLFRLVAPIFTLGLVLPVIFGVQGHATAAPTANLLKGHNPSFEQGTAEWTIIHFPGYTPKVINQSAGSTCGAKALRFKYTAGDTSAVTNSAWVPMSASTEYRFVIWLKIKGSANVRITAYEQAVGHPEENTGKTFFDNITSTDGQWKRFAGTFTSMPVAGEGYLNVWHKSGTGKFLLDCAAIKPLS